MELNEYQRRAMTTCMDSSENFAYMMLNLVGEVGEFAGKVAKGIRKGLTDIDCNELIVSHVVPEEELQKEAGDILWQLSGLCSVMGWPLEDIAQQNLDKLADRQQRHVIDGSGHQPSDITKRAITHRRAVALFVSKPQPASLQVYQELARFIKNKEPSGLRRLRSRIFKTKMQQPYSVGCCIFITFQKTKNNESNKTLRKWPRMGLHRGR